MNNTNTTNAVETVERHGVKLLAKTSKYGKSARQFCNLTQAKNALASIKASGFDGCIRAGHPFVVVVR